MDGLPITTLAVAKQTFIIQLYVEVLREIASGSIDPKSLALAAIREEV
ncbi:hypothetical protein LCGC14_0483760 [marine sediment metagenome]|uniref:Uncharacterized protein n=1 Tax=marine sediment metagenome TaxID=412755 RepID=A0A0F9S8G0_9ZZZZ